jgi:putative PEP-CTERM system TPR-repeat lipoprotein
LTKLRNPGALRATVLAGLLAGLLAACGSPDNAELLTSARQLLAKNDPAAARLQIKNVLQNDPKSGEARLMLGKLMHDSGDMAGAEAELDRALALGQAEADVLPLLAEALIGLQKGRILVQRYAQVDLPEPLADARLKTQLATAEAIDNDLPAAQALLDRALQRSADYPPALLLKARLAAAGGDSADALLQLDRLLVNAPQQADAWLLKGELLLRASPTDRDGATNAYREALKIKPDLVQAHSALILLQMAKPDVPAANQQFALLQKAAPKHPQTLLLEAMLADQRGDDKRARELTQLLLRGAPDNLQVLMLAGQTEMKLNALSQAETLFAKAVQVAPKAAAPRRQLAQLQLRSGQADKAMITLRPLIDADPPDVQALALTAQAQLMTGDNQGADASFARAAKLNPQDSRVRTSIALSQLAKGQDGAAMAELQAIAASDKGNSADLALISAKVQRSDFAGALKAIDGLAAKMPDEALPDQLRGRIALQRKDLAGARQHFEQALVKNPDFMPALAGLAALDLSDKKPELAKARFEAALQRNPKNSAALLALAEIAARSGGQPAEVVQWLDKAVAADPTDLTARRLLIDQYLSRRQTPQALSAAQAALIALPDNAELLDRLGRAQLLSGQTGQAVSTFGKLAALNPRAPLPQLRLADAQAAAKNSSAMAAAVRRAYEIAPDALASQQAMVSLAMIENKPEQALAIARKVQAQHPDDAVGHGLEGEIEQRQKHWDNAAAAYRKALTLKQPGDSAQRLHASLLAGKKKPEADKLAADWRRDHPDDLAFVLYLGDIAMAGNALAQAEQQYQLVLTRQPDNVLALNNLAYAMALQKKPGALALAERVQKLAPDTPALMDTLAFCLAAENQLPRAVEVQTKVVAAAPEAAQFRLQLAKLLLQSGNKPAARIELNTLAKLGPAFGRQAEVADLLKSSGT